MNIRRELARYALERVENWLVAVGGYTTGEQLERACNDALEQYIARCDAETEVRKLKEQVRELKANR